MTQACSQHPAFAGSPLDQGRAIRDGTLSIDRRPNGMVLLRRVLARVGLIMDSACPPPRLAEDDPFPPEDRVRVRSITLLEAFYRAQAPKLLRFFARRTGRDDAQDLVQESFDRFVQADARATPIEQPEAYLGQIAKNLLRNRARAALARSMVVQSPDLVDRAHTADPIGQLEARAELQQLEAVLAEMRPKTRDIFVAHRIEGLSYKDIAERTGLSVKGVEWQMSQAIQQIDRALRRS